MTREEDREALRTLKDPEFLQAIQNAIDSPYGGLTNAELANMVEKGIQQRAAVEAQLSMYEQIVSDYEEATHIRRDMIGHFSDCDECSVYCETEPALSCVANDYGRIEEK